MISCKHTLCVNVENSTPTEALLSRIIKTSATLFIQNRITGQALPFFIVALCSYVTTTLQIVINPKKKVCVHSTNTDPAKYCNLNVSFRLFLFQLYRFPRNTKAETSHTLHTSWFLKRLDYFKDRFLNMAILPSSQFKLKKYHRQDMCSTGVLKAG